MPGKNFIYPSLSLGLMAASGSLSLYLQNMRSAMNKLYEIISKVLNVPPDKITDESSPDNTPGWDSFNGLLLVTEIESGFKIKLQMDEVMAVRNVADIKKLLKKRGIEEV